MAEPLKNSFTPAVVETIGDMMAWTWPEFDRDRYLALALAGFDELEFTARAKHVCEALAAVLPDDRGAALEIATRAIAYPFDDAPEGLASFLYMPFGYLASEYGLDHFEPSMTLQYELTQRFTAEFCIRAFLERHPDQTLGRLRVWATDPSHHVRRLVSEGTRPRLPWAARLPAFQKDPAPVLELLELLKDDPEEYVRRSVANNLNDIAKDHPQTVIEVARRWWADGDATRRRLIRHALRTLVKQGDEHALGILGFTAAAQVQIDAVRCEPTELRIGDAVRIEVELQNPGDGESALLVDLRVHFMKHAGDTRPKVFKGAVLELGPGERRAVRKTISLKQRTTRTHYPGLHRVEVLINGVTHPGAEFLLHGE